MAIRSSLPTEDFDSWVTPWLPDLWRFAVSLSSLDDADDLRPGLRLGA
jgi:DNA-directed RNA polymerase specialized sigma24 family protein